MAFSDPFDGNDAIRLINTVFGHTRVGTPFEDYSNLTIPSVDHSCTLDLNGSESARHFRNGIQASQK